METRKEQIIQTAARLFKQKGYSAVTMRDLANALDIKAASLYNHITSKQSILQHIVIAIAEDFTKGMATILKEQQTSVTQLKALIALHLKIAIQNPDGLSALNADWMHLEDKLDYYLKLRNEYEANFRYIIKEGVKNNELKPVNVDVVVFSMLSTLRSLYLWIPKKEHLNQERLKNELSTVLIKGINK